MRVLLTGGGTGGHIYPALALGQALQARGADVLYVGTARGLEARLVPQAGIALRLVAAQGIRGRGVAGRAAGLALAAVGFLQAHGVCRAFRPDVCVGTGGYVSGPVCLAARFTGARVLVVQVDASPGLTTGLLARLADRVAVPYDGLEGHFPPSVRPRLVVTGSPVRPEVVRLTRAEGRRALGLPAKGAVVLLFGGSRGARYLNEAGALLVAPLGQRGATLVWATGEAYYDDYRRLAGRPGVLLVPYLERMPAALAAADLVVCRAGAMTLAEVTARGLPAVLVPSPNVVGNHQEMNARVLAERGAALVLRERDTPPGELVRAVLRLLDDDDRLQAMAAASRALGRPDALERLTALVEALAEPHRRRRP